MRKPPLDLCAILALAVANHCLTFLAYDFYPGVDAYSYDVAGLQLLTGTNFDPFPKLFRPPVVPPEKSVSLYNTHTGEAVNAVYWAEGQYLPESLAAIDHILRDHRTDEIKPIDPLLLDLLHAIRQELGCHQAFHIISGYRSPETNAYLRSVSRAVAEHSLGNGDQAAVSAQLT